MPQVLPPRTIPRAEIQRHVSFDPKGYLFSWNEGLFRAIYPERAAEVRELFECGLIPELVERGLFPTTEITDLRTEDSALVLRHERIPAVTLPAEWSFGMLKDAALTVLDVNIVARRHGYQTIDAHGFNVVFDRARPLFVDIGSFVALRNDFGRTPSGWKPYKEFMRCFHAPLSLRSRGESFFARHALHGDQLPLSAYWRHGSALLRLLPARHLELFEYLYYNYKALDTISVEDFDAFSSASPRRRTFGRWIKWLDRRGWLPFASVDLARLRSRIDRIAPPHASGAGADCHVDPGQDARFGAVVDRLGRYAVRSVVDMAGSAGALSRRIAALPGVDWVSCIDRDEEAIERLYRETKRERLPVQPVLADFRQSVAGDIFPSAPDRLRADAVLALALTHHLILSQGMTLDFIFLRLKRFTRRYVFVEFVSSGLSGSDHGGASTPKGYTLDWFRVGFAKHFDLLEEIELAPDRILLVGESLPGAGPETPLSG